MATATARTNAFGYAIAGEFDLFALKHDGEAAASAVDIWNLKPALKLVKFAEIVQGKHGHKFDLLVRRIRERFSGIEEVLCDVGSVRTTHYIFAPFGDYAIRGHKIYVRGKHPKYIRKKVLRKA